MYISIIEKLEDRRTQLAMEIAYGVDQYNINAGEYPDQDMMFYARLTNKKEKIIAKMGEISWYKCHDVYDEAGYILGSEYAITICGKEHKHLFGEDTTLPNGKTIGWKTIAV